MDLEITTEIVRNDRVSVEPIVALAPQSECLVVGLCVVGKVREENQDFMGYFQRDGGHYLVVADGMGGHNGGWEASHAVVAACEQALEEWAEGHSPKHLLSDSVQLANTKLLEQAAFEPKLQGMGSTYVGVYVRDGQAWTANVGDSRSYLIRKGEIKRISRDHSRVGMMVEAGLLTEEAARKHPMSNVLEMALGLEDFVAPEMCNKPLQLEPGDRLLLCSDGLWGLVMDEELLSIFSKEGLQTAANKALEMALSRGAHDNVTLALLEFQGEGERPGEGAQNVESQPNSDLPPERNKANLLLWELALLGVVVLCVGMAWTALRLQSNY
jgi:protein phosphatase